MQVDKVIEHLTELNVKVKPRNGDVYFYRKLPTVQLAGIIVVGHLEVEAENGDVPEKEVEALYRRLWLGQEFPPK